VIDPKPHLRTGAEVRAQIDALVPNEQGGFVGYGEEHMWTHKSGLTRRPRCFVQEMVPRHCETVRGAGGAGAGLQLG
jgi:hypothetical protein